LLKKKKRRKGIADPHSDNKTVKTTDSTFSANLLPKAGQRETCRDMCKKNYYELTSMIPSGSMPSGPLSLGLQRNVTTLAPFSYS